MLMFSSLARCGSSLILCTPSVFRHGSLHSYVRIFTSDPPKISPSDELALDTWIQSLDSKVIHYPDELTRSKLRDLYCTLPTRDPSHNLPSKNEEIFPLHCLAFFHPRVPEEELSEDLTETHFCPPRPFGARRMWVGGAFQFPNPIPIGHHSRKSSDQDGLRVGDEAFASVSVSKVERKGIEKGSPIIFVHKDVDYVRRIGGSPIIKEKRIHAYLPEGTRPSGDIREVDVRPRPRYTHTWTPTATTLFRFSALMWNAHLIHLDREYTRNEEGYPDLLVHGPLTAIMLVEALVHSGYKGRISKFGYRARNPIYVDRRQHVHVAINDNRNTAVLWTEDDDGVVGMMGSADILP